MRPTEPFVSIVQSRLYPPYFVSRDGRIFRLRKGKLKEISCKRTRYRAFTSCLKGKRTEALVHRAVAYEFCRGYEEEKVVNHIDNNPFNNYFTNLEWVTQKQNIHHRDAQGRTAKKERHHNSKLTNDIVSMIRSSNKSCHKIAKELGVNFSTIASVRKGETWKN